MSIRVVLLFLMGLVACVPETKEDSELEQALQRIGDDLKQISEAKWFDVFTHDGYKEVIVHNPWKEEKALGRYALVPKTAPLPEVPDDVLIVRTPVERIVIMSTTHAGPLLELGLQDRIIAADETDYYYHPVLRERVAKGEVTEVGSLSDLNLELLVDLEPDLVMLSAMEGTLAKAAMLKDAGIPYVVNIDWMEETPLARAEWIKFMALFFEQEAAASSYYDSVATHYRNLRDRYANVENPTRVLMGTAFKGEWHMPMGDSYAARFLKDAGATYDWIDQTGTGSTPLSFEAVLERSHDAPIWLNPSAASSLLRLRESDQRHGHFAAFLSGEVYNNNRRMNDAGGNDYWESGVVHPDLILQDLITILHPDSFTTHELHYYQRLPE